MFKYNAPQAFGQQSLQQNGAGALAVLVPADVHTNVGRFKLVPVYFLAADGVTPDRSKLLTIVNAFYEKYEPSREAEKREALVATIVEKGWDSVNEALTTKYGHALPKVAGDAMSATDLRRLVEDYYNMVDPSRPPDARDLVLDLIKKDGWEAVNVRMQTKYGTSLMSLLVANPVSQQVLTGAPYPEQMMRATPGMMAVPLATLAMQRGLRFKEYTFSMASLASCLTCGGMPICTITDVESGSTITVGFGCCMEYPCYQNGKHFAMLCLKGAGDGTWVKVPTLMSDSYQMLAQCYLAQTSVCCGSLLYLLRIIGFMNLEAPLETCNMTSLTFYDSQRHVAVEVSYGLCGARSIMRAREDIPFYALALIPFKDANQRKGGN